MDFAKINKTISGFLIEMMFENCVHFDIRL